MASWLQSCAVTYQVPPQFWRSSRTGAARAVAARAAARRSLEAIAGVRQINKAVCLWAREVLWGGRSRGRMRRTMVPLYGFEPRSPPPTTETATITQVARRQLRDGRAGSTAAQCRTIQPWTEQQEPLGSVPDRSFHPWHSSPRGAKAKPTQRETGGRLRRDGRPGNTTEEGPGVGSRTPDSGTCEA